MGVRREIGVNREHIGDKKTEMIVFILRILVIWYIFTILNCISSNPYNNPARITLYFYYSSIEGFNNLSKVTHNNNSLKKSCT